MHVTRKDPHSIMSPDSLRSLAEEYAHTFEPVPGGPDKLTWEVIADANFPTNGLSTEERKRQINKILNDKKEGIQVSDGVNYAFKPGLRLTIPYQKVIVPAVTIGEIERRWWYSVIVGKDKHQSIAAWFQSDGGRTISLPAFAHRWIPVEKN